ncbi:dihydrodipicolinate synthase family protein [Ruania suaedae]|uniref:dihydrodipicolinate synthase family protein n=1 Tax=Ruania suaedae TaxID=2897774 RepID=UPI001E588F9A|nr:dihydrodipicolinate synthase family protein [Ruania suaedae]UFU02861.1 dihydrodipicolinate synthase family protein [Ruania suaedae]
MSTHPPISGLVPVLATPFTDDGGLDLDSLERLIEFQLASSADGLAIFGMASEAFSLSDDERHQILRTTVATAHDIPVVAGVSATGLSAAVDQVRVAADGGAAGVMVLPPHLVKPQPAHLIDFYGGVGEEAQRLDIDVMVQDAPGATGVQQSVALLGELARLPGVASIKVEAPPTVPKIHGVVAEVADTQVVVLGGQNAQFVLDEYACGAQGTMPAAEFTDVLREILDRWDEGARKEARALFARLLPLIVWGLQAGPAWAVHKEVMHHRGIISSARVRMPAHTLEPYQRELLDEIVEQLDLEVRRA